MKFSYSWLKDLVEIKLSAEKLAEFLSLRAFETEVAKQSKSFENILVAKVTAAEKHPNADIQETMLDISVPANRPDLLSYRGVAWEIAALTGAKYKVSPSRRGGRIAYHATKLLKIRISEPKLCSKYLAVRLTNVKVGPSPKFIQERLKASGMRPINNVVDIANYVMLEVGQPLHAFDAGKVLGPINIRRAYVRETIKTLDEIERVLNSDMLLIADDKKALAIAGVIGGLDSGVGKFTDEIILESANFNAVSVRRTAKALGLRTDASVRFEKSLPVRFANLGLEYAFELLEKYAGGKVAGLVQAGAKTKKLPTILLYPNKVNQLLGINIASSEQKRILKRLGFSVQVSSLRFRVFVPFWRPDITIWQDLAEEIARFMGLDKIPLKLFAVPLSSHLTDPIFDLKDKVTDILVGLGFDEVYTYSFVSAQDLDQWKIDKKTAIEIANPLSLDQQYLRPNLALNVMKILLQKIKESEYVEFGKYFEIGNVFWSEQGKIVEKTYLFMLTFPRTKTRIEQLIGDFQELAARLQIEYQINQHEGQSAQIIVSNKIVGRLNTGTVQELDWAGINLDFVEFVKHQKPLQFKSIIKFPAIDLDTSIIIREDIPWVEIKKTILDINQKHVSEIKLIESSYQGKEIPPGKKSVTFRLVYQALDKTLTRPEVLKIHEQILRVLKSKFNAQTRD